MESVDVGLGDIVKFYNSALGDYLVGVVVEFLKLETSLPVARLNDDVFACVKDDDQTGGPTTTWLVHLSNLRVITKNVM